MIEESIPKGFESTFKGITKEGLTTNDLKMLKWRSSSSLGLAGAYKSCFGNVCKCCYFPCISCCPVGFSTVEEGYEGLKIVFGKYMEKLAPGIHSFNPCTEEIKKICIKSQIYNVPVQQ